MQNGDGRKAVGFTPARHDTGAPMNTSASNTSTPERALPSVNELLCRKAGQHPEKPAFRFLRDGEEEEAVLTYGGLHRRAVAIGGRLQKTVVAGEPVLLLYPPGLEFIEAFFGCLYAGALAVPAYPPRPRRPSPRLGAIIADARPGLVLSTRRLHSLGRNAFAKVPHLWDLPWLDVEQVDDDSASAWNDPASDPSTLAFLQYTSGSTAVPKGVMVSHGNLLHNLAFIGKAFRPRSDGWGVFWLPLYHDMGLVGGILQTLHAGGASTLMSPADFLHAPKRWLQAISRTRAIISGGPDFAYDYCVRKIPARARRDLDLSSWEVAFTGAEPIRSETIERFAAAFAPCGFRKEAFYPCYGLAEATLMVAGGRKEEPPVVVHVRRSALKSHRVELAQAQDADACSLVSCGHDVDDQHLAIVDPTTRRTCPEGHVGEIWVCGRSVAQGYFHAPEASETTFRARILDNANGFYLRTGDLAFLRNGELFVTGRLKDLIVIRGQNYYPQDIEWSVQQSHPRLRAGGCAAFSVEIAGREEVVVAAEVPRHHRDLDPDELIVALREAVAVDHEIELYAVVLLKSGALPKTSSGKVRRHACREGFLAECLPTVACWTNPTLAETPSSSGDLPSERPSGVAADATRSAESVEAFLVGLLSRRLDRLAEDFDVGAPFASLGINSVQVVELTGELEKWLKRPLPPTFFYNYPTITALAEHLASERTANGRQAPGGREMPAPEAPREHPRSSKEDREFVADEAARLEP